MKNHWLSFIPMVFLTLVIGQSMLCADLAPAPWPMYRQNGYHTGVSTTPASGSVGILKWKYQTDNHVNSSPAIGVDGTIYFGSDDNYVYALYPNGTLKWKYMTGGYVYSSPAIDSDGTIYVGGLDKYVYALNSDGTLKWR